MKYPFVSILLSLSLTAAASAALTIHVDIEAQQYYLSGSAMGIPEQDFMEEEGYIFWDNGEAYNGGYVNLFSAAAFTVAGNNPIDFQLFLHGNGNVNGGFTLESTNTTTLTGNPAVRYDYSGWAPAVRTELESKALSGDVIGVGNGASPSFALNFAAIPEPGSAALLSIPLLGLAFSRRRTARSV